MGLTVCVFTPIGEINWGLWSARIYFTSEASNINMKCRETKNTQTSLRWSSCSGSLLFFLWNYTHPQQTDTLTCDLSEERWTFWTVWRWRLKWTCQQNVMFYRMYFSLQSHFICVQFLFLFLTILISVVGFFFLSFAVVGVKQHDFLLRVEFPT